MKSLNLLSKFSRNQLIIAGLILIALSLPITILLVRQTQDLRGRAAEPDKIEAEGGVLSASNVKKVSDTTASGGQYVLFSNPSPTPTKAPTPTSAPVSAFIESGGSVVMEAEKNDGKFNRGGYRWDGALPSTSPQTDTANYGGTGYIAARPNDDLKTFFASAYNQGPEVIYNIKFTTTGTYYVYVRSSGVDAKSASAHIGLKLLSQITAPLNGSMSLYYVGKNSQTANWTWEKNNNSSDGGGRTIVNVSTPGLYTFHIWMREDGTKIDRIRLSQNKDWVASPNEHAIGPNESPRGTF